MTMQFAPPGTWQPPPQPALFGEIDSTGTRIILIGQGESFDLSVMAQRLSHVTPLLKVAEDPAGRKTGAMVAPLTWPAVNQISFSFSGGNGSARWVPLPRLQEWILAEFTRRTTPPEPLKAEFPPWLKLRPYQEEGAALIANARKFLLLDEVGTGKTPTTISGLAEIQARGATIFPMVIIVPSWGVGRSWMHEIGTWAPDWRAVLWGGVSGGVRRGSRPGRGTDHHVRDRLP
jgi:hypothetical protein